MRRVLVTEVTFGLGWRQASASWGWLIREDRESVKQSIHLAMLQIPSGDLKALNRAVGRELYRLAYDLGYRQRSYRMGLNELGHRWEKIVIAEGLRPLDSTQRRIYQRDMQRKGKSLRHS